MNRNVTIRMETSADAAAVRRANERAFGRAQEADLVERLRSSCPRLASLVAVVGDEFVGHALFTPVVIERSPGPLAGMGLAPIAVLPGFQRRGIG